MKKARYERFWDHYSDKWEEEYKPEDGEFLGDEWGSPEGTKGVFDRVIRPYLRPDATVIEIGPGGGKYSVLVAPHCKSLICVDVSQKMLDRTKERLRVYSHVQYVKTSGRDPLPCASQSADFIFSIDCFVHLDMPDFFSYLKEIHRVLKQGSFASIHFADLMTKKGWDKFVQELNWDKEDLTAPFGFITHEIARKFAQELNLEIVLMESSHRDGHMTIQKR
jgi:ubiquinone/menaquinone biosynthesis C-methylase UbiE